MKKQNKMENSIFDIVKSITETEELPVRVSKFNYDEIRVGVTVEIVKGPLVQEIVGSLTIQVNLKEKTFTTEDFDWYEEYFKVNGLDISQSAFNENIRITGLDTKYQITRVDMYDRNIDSLLEELPIIKALGLKAQSEKK